MLQSSGNLLPQSFREVSIFEQPACHAMEATLTDTSRLRVS
jgi:hypothetical protein